MHKALNGKGYIKNGKGTFITATGEIYAYHDGQLTPLPTAEDPKAHQGAAETSELQPLHDARKSFHGKAHVERRTTAAGTRLALKSYDTTVAVVTPDADAYRVEIAMRHLSATTLRHVKEFLAQTDDAFKGITLPWLRKAVKDGRKIEGTDRKVYVLNEL